MSQLIGDKCQIASGDGAPAGVDVPRLIGWSRTDLRVLDIVASRFQPKRVAMAGTLEHEEDEDRIAAFLDIEIA